MIIQNDICGDAMTADNDVDAAAADEATDVNGDGVDAICCLALRGWILTLLSDASVAIYVII